ncbi:uncharacterized protein LOC124275011 isoform X24 [Haliotis rubra]|uniref:uncharacterized protein LOC124275011 isoform X24 n=1 Tax=Haliotis rubra TaxID=36100 RepID=UPI001EE5F77B|nr:uncharacterized protein LOC124275011 isoform X24 [Haliotis rubra]
MFIETLEFTIPVELCNVFSSLQKGPTSNVEFPASVNSYGTTQDANVQVVLRSNKLTFKVDGVSSNASMISKSECKTLKLSVFDVDRTLMPQENDNDNYNSNNMSTIQTVQQTVYLSHPAKRLHESSVSMPQPAAKSSRTSFSESPRPRSPVHRRPHSQISSSPSNHSHQSKPKNDTPVNVKQEPEDPDLIEIEPDHDPDDVVPKKETPYMQIDYSSDVPHTQTSKAALDRLSHPQSSHSQSPGSSSSSFYQNVPHVPDYAEPSTSQARYGDQSADDFLVFQDENDDGDDNEADYSNDGGPRCGLKIASSSFRGLSPRLSRWQCELCLKTFASQQSKKAHVEAVHHDVTYTCLCGHEYKYMQGLNKHKRKCVVFLNQQSVGSLHLGSASSSFQRTSQDSSDRL